MLSYTNGNTAEIGKAVLEQSPHSDQQSYADIGKRIFDLAVASIATLLILSWLIPILGVLIKLNSPGPILFIQLRTGRNGQQFRCFKLRSMTYERNPTFKQATIGDPRITKIGAFLRKTNLDELPQFINVLKGEMSIVGPRPHAIQHDAEYWHSLSGYRERYLIKPGITGLAQVRGCRGETSQVMQMKHRIRLDHWYIVNRSLKLDLKILLWTIGKMLSGDKNAR